MMVILIILMMMTMTKTMMMILQNKNNVTRKWNNAFQIAKKKGEKKENQSLDCHVCKSTPMKSIRNGQAKRNQSCAWSKIWVDCRACLCHIWTCILSWCFHKPCHLLRVLHTGPQLHREPGKNTRESIESWAVGCNGGQIGRLQGRALKVGPWGGRGASWEDFKGEHWKLP